MTLSFFLNNSPMWENTVYFFHTLLKNLEHYNLLFYTNNRDMARKSNLYNTFENFSPYNEFCSSAQSFSLSLLHSWIIRTRPHLYWLLNIPIVEVQHVFSLNCFHLRIKVRQLFSADELINSVSEHHNSNRSIRLALTLLIRVVQLEIRDTAISIHRRLILSQNDPN